MMLDAFSLLVRCMLMPFQWHSEIIFHQKKRLPWFIENCYLGSCGPNKMIAMVHRKLLFGFMWLISQPFFSNKTVPCAWNPFWNNHFVKFSLPFFFPISSPIVAAQGLNGYNHFHRIAKGGIQQTSHLFGTPPARYPKIWLEMTILLGNPSTKQ